MVDLEAPKLQATPQAGYNLPENATTSDSCWGSLIHRGAVWIQGSLHNLNQLNFISHTSLRQVCSQYVEIFILHIVNYEPDGYL